MTIRVLVADDSDLLIIGVKTVLECERGFAVAGTARNPADLFTLITAEQPDAVLLSEWLGGRDVLGIIERLKERDCIAKTIVLGSQTDGLLIHDLMNLGALGYLYRCDDLEAHLIPAVQTAMRGRPYLSPLANAEYLVAMRSPLRDWKLDNEAREVLRLLANGAFVEEISQRMNLTPRRVYWVREKLRRRFGARTNEHLIGRAIVEGFTNLASLDSAS